MTAPERIWADPPTIFDEMDCWHSDPHETRTEYIRADLARPTLTQALAVPEIAALVEALRRIQSAVSPEADPDTNELIECWMSADEMQEIASAALTKAPVDGENK